MQGRDEQNKLAALLDHLHRVMDMKFGLMDDQAREVYTASSQAEFCQLIKQSPDGMQRCRDCDRKALAQLGRKTRIYRCHCGLIEVAMPVWEEGRHTATILFGQLLDERPKNIQWEEVCSSIGWHPDQPALKKAFMNLRQISDSQLFSLTQIIHACISEVRLQGMLATAELSDGERLREYIKIHYRDPLNVKTLCDELHVGKTRLFEICRETFGCTPGEWILKTRIEAACELLETTELDVQTIAERTGIPDANYFAKRFRLTLGMPPSEYRKQKRSAEKIQIKKESAKRQ